MLVHRSSSKDSRGVEGQKKKIFGRRLEEVVLQSPVDSGKDEKRGASSSYEE